MRQNTKLVVASSDIDKTVCDRQGTKSTGKPQNKPARPASWTVEPWNGQRRKSIREANSPRKKGTMGPAPPLPGQESCVQANSGCDEIPDTPMVEGERGRLFVKVVGVKELNMPLPRSKFFADVGYPIG
jgi:hypothetical protein